MAAAAQKNTKTQTNHEEPIKRQLSPTHTDLFSTLKAAAAFSVGRLGSHSALMTTAAFDWRLKQFKIKKKKQATKIQQ